MVTVLGHREIDDVLGKFPEGSFPVMADVATPGGGVDHCHVTRPAEAAEDCLIGIGAADGPDLAMVAFKEELQIILQPTFDFVNVRCSPVIPFPRMSLGISVGEIRTGLRSGPLTHHIFAGDEVKARVPPSVLFLDQVLDFRHFLFIHARISLLFESIEYLLHCPPICKSKMGTFRWGRRAKCDKKCHILCKIFI